MNSDKAAAVRDSLNGCPTVIDDESIVEDDGEAFETRDETLTGDRMETKRVSFRPAEIQQSGTVGDGSGAKRPVFVVVLEPLWTEANIARSLPTEIVYEAAKHDVSIRFYPPEHHLGNAIWFIDHFETAIAESDGDRCPDCDSTYFKIRDGQLECARCGYTDAEKPRQEKLVTDGGRQTSIVGEHRNRDDEQIETPIPITDDGLRLPEQFRHERRLIFRTPTSTIDSWLTGGNTRRQQYFGSVRIEDYDEEYLAGDGRAAEIRNGECISDDGYRVGVLPEGGEQHWLPVEIVGGAE